MKIARVRRLAMAAVFAAALSRPADAQSPSPLPDFNVEDLLGVSVPRVFGASERLQPVTEAPSQIGFQLIATVRNLFNQPYGVPASYEHVSDAIQQNGRTARIGLRRSQGRR